MNSVSASKWTNRNVDKHVQLCPPRANLVVGLRSSNALSIGLEMNARATNFTRWMYSQIKPFVRRGSILEVGSGLGIFSKMLARDFGDRLCLTDIEPDYAKLLRETFRGQDRITIKELDLTISKHYRSIRNQKFDTILCMNWSGPRVLRTLFGFFFVWFHDSFSVTLILVRYS